jgi:hypothetical protein
MKAVQKGDGCEPHRLVLANFIFSAPMLAIHGENR